MSAPPIVLASTSRYRAELLGRIVDGFDRVAPGVDEDARCDESPRDLATRLAAAKADAVARDRPDSLVIGSDQVADLDGRVLGKPGDVATACTQLAACSGRTVRFLTAVRLVDTRHGGGVRDHLDETRVVFRTLDAATIARYVERERPLDCAGSFKVEGLGIALFERVETQDPTALVGLPLVALAAMLRSAGLALP